MLGLDRVVLGVGAVAVLLGSAAGCARMGMDRGAVTPTPAAQMVVDDPRIAQALAQRPQLPEHVRVGVFFQDPAPDSDGHGPSFRWDFEERQSIVDASKDIERVELFPLSDAVVEGADLSALRLAAARHGADALLVVSGHFSEESSTNGWAATYPLLVTMFFAPASDLEARFSMNAAMYDVRNGYLYLTAEAEAREEQQRAHIWIDSDSALASTKSEAVELLGQELAERIGSLAGVQDSTAHQAESGDEPEDNERTGRGEAPPTET